MTTVLVTGGAKRLGAAIVRRLAVDGARVVIHYGASGEEAAALAEEVGAAGCVGGDLGALDAIDDGEQELGVRCIAAPLRGMPFGAAISISGPDSRIRSDDVHDIAPQLIGIAEEVSEHFAATAGQSAELAG